MIVRAPFSPSYVTDSSSLHPQVQAHQQGTPLDFSARPYGWLLSGRSDLSRCLASSAFTSSPMRVFQLAPLFFLSASAVPTLRARQGSASLVECLSNASLDAVTPTSSSYTSDIGKSGTPERSICWPLTLSGSHSCLQSTPPALAGRCRRPDFAGRCWCRRAVCERCRSQRGRSRRGTQLRELWSGWIQRIPRRRPRRLQDDLGGV